MCKFRLDSHIIDNANWGVSEESETVYNGVNLRIGDNYLRASRASETVLGVDNANWVYVTYNVCMDGTYAPLTCMEDSETRYFRLDFSFI